MSEGRNYNFRLNETMKQGVSHKFIHHSQYELNVKHTEQ